MDPVNIHAAKTHLSHYLELIGSGAETEIVIAKAGKPIAKLVPFAPAVPHRTLGVLAGQIWEAPDAWTAETDAEVAAAFLGTGDDGGQGWGPGSLRVADQEPE